MRITDDKKKISQLKAVTEKPITEPEKNYWKGL